VGEHDSRMTRPMVLDLFAGCGGFSLGFEQAGFDVVASVEIDPIHSLVHHYNFPYCTSICKDIREVDSSSFLLDQKELDVLIGGAPCQGFSLIGKRQLDDDRNFLVRNYLRLVHELKPRYFVFENVKGITQGKHIRFLEEVITHAQDMGYGVIPWRVLDARFYGVPQARKRLILIGYRNDQAVPLYPEDLYHPYPEDLFSHLLPKTPTTQEVLDDIPDAELFPELDMTDIVRVNWRQFKDRSIQSYYRPQRDVDWLYGYKRNWDPQLLTSSARTNHTLLSRTRFAATAEGDTEPNSRFYKLRSNGYANTLRAGTDSSRGAFTSPRPLHYKYNRCVTVREMARLHGYPDWFRFHSTKWHGARQIGNSVPPPMARAVGLEIMKALRLTPALPEKILELGDERFLYFDMTQACSYLGIESPIKGRTIRGSYKKAKQQSMPLSA